MKQTIFALALIGSLCIGLSEQSCSPEFAKQFLAKHNALRAKHGSPALVLDNSISQWAQNWANHLASRNIFQHRKPNKYGENLYMSWSSSSVPHENGGKGVQMWYDEIHKYGTFGKEPNMHSFSNWGHFTQVVWKSTQKVGVGCAVHGHNFYVVGNYEPAGNMIGSFAANVPAPQ